MLIGYDSDVHEDVHYEAIEAYMEMKEELESRLKMIVPTNKKITRSGNSYIAKINGAVLSASTRRISAKKAVKLYEQQALDSMFTELKILNDERTLTVVEPNTLTKRELKYIIR